MDDKITRLKAQERQNEAVAALWWAFGLFAALGLIAGGCAGIMIGASIGGG